MPIRTQVDLAIQSDDLRVNEITDLLGINPTDAFHKGEIYLGKKKTPAGIVSIERKRTTGVWHFSTEGFVINAEPSVHLEYLLT